jgi:hypothetical protein
VTKREEGTPAEISGVQPKKKEGQQMKASGRSVLVLLILGMPTAYGQKAYPRSQQKPVETTVCKMLEDPSAYNNRLVRVRGLVQPTED